MSNSLAIIKETKSCVEKLEQILSAHADSYDLVDEIEIKFRDQLLSCCEILKTVESEIIEMSEKSNCAKQEVDYILSSRTSFLNISPISL